MTEKDRKSQLQYACVLKEGEMGRAKAREILFLKGWHEEN